METAITNERVQKLKNIIAIINQGKTIGKPLNRYEYYKLGGISFKNAESELSELLRDKKLTASEVNVLRNYIEFQNAIGVPRQKERVLDTQYQFGNRVITDIEKESIWDGLLSFGLNEYDIDDLVFSGAVRDYAKANGLIPNKKSTR